MGRSIARGWVLAGVLGWHADVHADADTSAPRVDVDWHAPATCPRERFVEGLARHLAASEAGPVDVMVEVEDHDGTWRLAATLAVDGNAFAPRGFSGRSCDAVVDAAALATAIAIDPIHAAVEPSPSPAVVPEPSAAAVPEVVEPPTPSMPPPPVIAAPVHSPTWSKRPPPRRTRGFVALAAAVDGGALPGIGAGLGAGIGVIHGRARIELVGGWRAPVMVRSLDVPGAGARIDLFHLGLRACGAIPVARVIELPMCAGIDSGVVRGRGFGLTSERAARLWWNAAIASAGVMWLVGRHLAVFARSELGVPLRLHQFAIAGLDTVDRVAPVFGRGLVGLEARLP